MPDQAPNYEPGNGGKLAYDKDRKTIVHKRRTPLEIADKLVNHSNTALIEANREWWLLHIAAAIKDERDQSGKIALQTLAHAVLKFAPDLATELTTRWHKAKSDNDAALNEFLAVLRGHG